MKLEWFGDRLARKVSEACVKGVDQTMAACVTDAKAEHEWVNQTGTLEGSLRIAQFASALGVIIPAAGGATVTGTWGSADVNYALYEEIGTSLSGPTAEERASAGGLLGHIAPPIGPRMKARPYLRPAADKLYPTLRSRIRVFYNTP